MTTARQAATALSTNNLLRKVLSNSKSVENSEDVISVIPEDECSVDYSVTQFNTQENREYIRLAFLDIHCNCSVLTDLPLSLHAFLYRSCTVSHVCTFAILTNINYFHLIVFRCHHQFLLHFSP